MDVSIIELHNDYEPNLIMEDIMYAKVDMSKPSSKFEPSSNILEKTGCNTVAEIFA